MIQERLDDCNNECGCNDNDDFVGYGGGAKPTYIQSDPPSTTLDDDFIEDTIIIAEPEVEINNQDTFKPTEIENMETQKINIYGTVIDEFNEPLPDAHIYEVGNSQNGTITDGNGQFSLIIDRTAQVAVSFIGLDTMNYNAIDVPDTIKMTSDNVLDDVVINVPKKSNYASVGYFFGGILILSALAKLFGKNDEKTVKATL